MYGMDLFLQERPGEGLMVDCNLQKIQAISKGSNIDLHLVGIFGGFCFSTYLPTKGIINHKIHFRKNVISQGHGEDFLCRIRKKLDGNC